MTQLTITELKLFTRGRAGVGLGVSVGIPLLLVIIFGSIHSFKTPVKAFGGLTTKLGVSDRAAAVAEAFNRGRLTRRS